MCLLSLLLQSFCFTHFDRAISRRISLCCRPPTLKRVSFGPHPTGHTGDLPAIDMLLPPPAAARDTCPTQVPQWLLLRPSQCRRFRVLPLAARARGPPAAVDERRAAQACRHLPHKIQHGGTDAVVCSVSPGRLLHRHCHAETVEQVMPCSCLMRACHYPPSTPDIRPAQHRRPVVQGCSADVPFPP